jgi:hypothetical protein
VPIRLGIKLSTEAKLPTGPFPKPLVPFDFLAGSYWIQNSCSLCGNKIGQPVLVESRTYAHGERIVGLSKEFRGYAAELGYDVTVVKDAIADYSDEMMRAALDVNMPNYASAIVSTEEIVDAIAGR